VIMQNFEKERKEGKESKERKERKESKRGKREKWERGERKEIKTCQEKKVCNTGNFWVEIFLKKLPKKSP
jgi:hypothetical protein